MDTSFGIHLVSNTQVDAYLNGTRVGSFTVPDAHLAGSNVVLAHFNDPGNSPQQTVNIERFELRSAPGGTLLAADDFTSLASWTGGVNSSGWTVTGGQAVGTGIGASVLYRSDLGAAYAEIQGITFSNYYSSQDAWIMLILRDPGTGTPFSGSNGYRLLLRQPGASQTPQIPGVPRVYEPDGTLIAVGWSVGMVRVA